jgi:hypothetical protein
MSRSLFTLFTLALLPIHAASAQQALTLPAPTLLAAQAHREHRPRLCATGAPCSLTLRLSLPAASPPDFARARTRALRPRLNRAPLSAFGASAASSPRAASSTLLRFTPQVAPGVGKRVTLRGGRELSLQLTPTPTRCAPLLSVRY